MQDNDKWVSFNKVLMCRLFFSPSVSQGSDPNLIWTWQKGYEHVLMAKSFGLKTQESQSADSSCPISSIFYICQESSPLLSVIRNRIEMSSARASELREKRNIS